MKYKPSSDRAWRLAKRIARDLFMGRFGRANNLNQIRNGKYMGGWSELAMASLIYRHLPRPLRQDAISRGLEMGTDAANPPKRRRFVWEEVRSAENFQAKLTTDNGETVKVRLVPLEGEAT